MSLERNKSERTTKFERQTEYLPSGTQWLSHTFDIVRVLDSRASGYKRGELWRRAIDELRTLAGGEIAHERALQKFQTEHGRLPGEINKIHERFERRHPSAKGRIWSYDDNAELDSNDHAILAHLMSAEFQGELNPRNREFREKFFREHERWAEITIAEMDENMFATSLKFMPSDIPGPTEAEHEKIRDNFLERWGKYWDEMDEADFYENSGAAIDALRFFSGHGEAKLTAIKEWESIEALLRKVQPWHSFYSDQDEYVTRRTNALLGSPLQLDHYQFAESELRLHLDSYVIMSIDCDALLSFVKLQNIPNGKDFVYRQIHDTLQQLDYEGAAEAALKGEGFHFDSNPNEYVRRLNTRLGQSLRLKDMHR